MTPDLGLPTRGSIKGTFAESRRAFDEFLKGAPEDPRKLTARYRLGELAYLVGDLAAARRSLEEFSAATTDHPGLEMALTYLGDTCFGLQDFTAARVAYQRSLAAYPGGTTGGPSKIWPGADSGGPGATRSGPLDAARAGQVNRSPNGSTGPGCKLV